MSRVSPNSQYSAIAPGGVSAKIVTYQRRRMFQRFLDNTGVLDEDLVLDVGVTSDQSYESSNYLEAWYPIKNKITALGVDDASHLESQYPGVKFVSANGLRIPFDDMYFDVVHSSAVIEHVGSFENQVRFLMECGRVARKALFITTPNRWFPIEFHTVLPLLHWAPRPMHRWILSAMHMGFFANEKNLNLLGPRDLREMANQLPDFDVEVTSVSLAGWPSNLLLTAKRKSARTG